MYLKFILKLKKRAVFEATKKIKKIKFYVFREWVSDKKHGDYVENRVVEIEFEKILKFYEGNSLVRAAEINDAEEVLKGKLNLLYFDNDETIENWNMDYGSGFVYPIKYHGDIKYIVDDKKTDVKNVWELSRLQHLILISKAYIITLDEKYYIYFKKCIISWIANNPNGKSVNWTCNMEVAIRVVNLIVCYEILRNRISEDSGFERVIKSSIYYHNKYIVENLEDYSETRNNHYLANLMGLLISSKFLEFKDVRKYTKYSKFSRVELQKEMDKQIYDDGVTYEISTSYQKLVYEILLFSIVLGQAEGNEFEKKYIDKVHEMFLFLKAIRNENGSIPLIGDNDSGSVLVINDYFNKYKSNLNSLVHLSEYYFNGASDILDDALLFLKKRIGHYPDSSMLATKFENSGYYLLKNKLFKMVILCGPLSMKGQGGHSHNDQLSFILNVDGLPVFIDPGTITYTGNRELRDYSRRTSSHNTVQIDDEEQNIIGQDLFALNERTLSKCINYSRDYFEGIHQGYVNKYNCHHRRVVRLCDDNVSIEDVVLDRGGAGRVEAKLHLVLSSEVEIIVSDGLIGLEFSGRKLMTNLKLDCCSINEIFVSERYGRYHQSKRITCEFIGEHKLIMSFK